MLMAKAGYKNKAVLDEFQQLYRNYGKSYLNAPVSKKERHSHVWPCWMLNWHIDCLELYCEVFSMGIQKRVLNFLHDKINAKKSRAAEQYNADFDL